MALEAFESDASIFSAPIFGGGLPAEAERLLKAAAQSYDRSDDALSMLREAERLAPAHLAVLIGLYRFFFYKGRLTEALDVACACLRRAAQDAALSPDWRQVAPDDAPFDSFDAPLARFYMFSLKGYAYLKMRLGDVEEGQAAISKLLELDPSDKIGARVLQGVLDRIGVEDVE